MPEEMNSRANDRYSMLPCLTSSRRRNSPQITDLCSNYSGGKKEREKRDSRLWFCRLAVGDGRRLLSGLVCRCRVICRGRFEVGIMSDGQLGDEVD